MKAKSILALLLLCLPFGLAAQDLVVTQADDSVKCRISGVYEDLIEFTHLQNGRRIRTQLAMAAVKSYRLNYYYVSPVEKRRPELPPRPQWSMGFGVGYAYRSLKMPSSTDGLFDEHLQGIRGGRFLDLDVAYYCRNGHGLGLGLRLTDFSAYNKSRFEFYWGGITRSDDVYIRNIGPYLSKRFVSSGERNELSLRLGGGLSIYRHRRVEPRNDEDTIDATFMAFIDVGYNFVIIKGLGIGPSLSWFVAIPRRGDDLQVGHLALDVSLRYIF